MPYNAKLTDRERAAVKLAVAYAITSTSTLYRLAYNGTEEQAKATDPAVMTRWWKSKRIQTALEEESAHFAARIKAAQDKAVSDHISREHSRREGTAQTPEGWVDYTDPANWQRELNRIANDPSLDDKQRFEAVKLLISSQKSQESDEAKNNDIQRFYTPLRCQDCPLYKIELERINEEKKNQ